MTSASTSLTPLWIQEAGRLGPQPPFGATLTRLTSAPIISDDIYGEQPQCTPDGQFIAFARYHLGQPQALWVADLASTRIALLRTHCERTATTKYTGRVYYTSGAEDGAQALMRLDLSDFTEDVVCDMTDVPSLISKCITSDERYCFGMHTLAPKQYQIVRVDLTDGTATVVYEDPDICNPHLQTIPGGHDLLVQHNRGCSFDDRGRMTALIGPQGATLFVIDAEGGNYRQIPVGTPYAEWPATGHECWVGESGIVAYTEACPRQVAETRGNFVAARPGDERAVPLAPGYYLNHISVSMCGRFFVGDANGLEGVPLILGAIATGRTVMLCHSQTTPSGAQFIHTHPYITPDNRRVVFNSDRSGVPQVYAVDIPAGLLDALTRNAGLDPAGR